MVAVLDKHDQWVGRVLGVDAARARWPLDQPVEIVAAPPRPAAAPAPSLLQAASSATVLDKAVAPSILAEPARQFQGASGKTLQIRVAADGHVALTAPPPPVRELTFSGGGGKGAALAGAVDALAPVMQDVTVVKGASVGSMTAAILAAGVTPEDFTAISNDPETTNRILEGRNKYSAILGGMLGKLKESWSHGLEGTGLENLVRDKMNAAAKKQIEGFMASPDYAARQASADPLLPQVQAILAKIDAGKGLTFKDMRTLHQVIPAIKEIEISATLIGDSTPGDGGMAAEKPQLAMFTADTQPDMEVALAARASASLPPVFKPVTIELEGGFKGKFQDGGVMNNAPAGNTVQAERDVDPLPASSRMTFVFQDDDGQAEALQKGIATPSRNAMNDMMSGAPMSAAVYGQSRLMADSPQDVVVVPLKFTDPAGKQQDFAGTISGTLNFSMPVRQKQELQALTANATAAHIEQQQLPKTHEFACVRQMLDCVARDDLAALAQQGFAGAAEELAFRDAVLADVAKLIALHPNADDQFTPGPVKDVLDRLEALTEGDPDRQGFVARELNRSGDLDPLLDKAVALGSGGNGALAAGAEMASALKAQSHAQNVLREVIYPRLVEEEPNKPNALVLRQADDLLRAARTPGAVNAALDLVIRQYRAGQHGSTAFAAACAQYKLSA